MALTLEAEQRLEAVDLIALFDSEKADWKKLAKKSYDFVRDTFPKNASIRPDDVAKALLPLLEVDPTLGAHVKSNKLKQKYWIRDFCDLILDRTWPEIAKTSAHKKD